MSVLEYPYYLGKTGARTMFSIQTNSGKTIRAHSYFEKEDEILLPPGIYLEVIDILNPAADLHIIQLREITPQYQIFQESSDILSSDIPSKESMPSSCQSTLEENQVDHLSTALEDNLQMNEPPEPFSDEITKPDAMGISSELLDGANKLEGNSKIINFKMRATASVQRTYSSL